MRLEKLDQSGNQSGKQTLGLRARTHRRRQRQSLGHQRAGSPHRATSEFKILFPALENTLNKEAVNWPHQLFIKHGNLFLKLLQNKAESTKLEIDGLIRI